MFSIITKKQIIHKHLSFEDRCKLMSDYTQSKTNIAMIYGRIPLVGGRLLDKTNDVPGIIIGDDIYFFICDDCVWILGKELADRMSTGEYIIFGFWDKKSFNGKSPTPYFVEYLDHPIHKDYKYIQENDLEEMRQAIQSVIDDLDLQRNQDPQYHLEAIHYILEYHNLYHADSTVLFEFRDIMDHLKENWVYSNNSIILGLINVLSGELAKHGYLDMSKDDYDFRRVFKLTDKGVMLMNALRLEGLDSAYSEPYTHDFYDRSGWTDVDE